MDGAVAHAVMLIATSGGKSDRIADSGQSGLPDFAAARFRRKGESFV